MSENSTRYLGDVPADWLIKTVKDIGDVIGGSTPSRVIPGYWNGDIPWVTPGELTGLKAKYLDHTRDQITKRGLESCGAKLVPAETLLVTSRATIGSVAMVRRPTATNQGFKSIVFGREAFASFYFHLFKRLIPELERRASGTTFLEISSREFCAVPVPVPPLHEQQRVAEILDTIDEAIRKTEQVVAKLMQIKRGLLHDLLTFGIDDNSELRDPLRHPDQFNDSALGLIPRSWRTSAIESLLRSSIDGPFGSNLKTEHYVAHPGVRLVRLQNIGSGAFLDDEKSWIAESHARRLAKHDVRPGDVLVASLGDPTHPFARSCLYPLGHAPGIVKADCFRFRTGDELEASFLVNVLNTPRWRTGLTRLVNRSGISRDRVNLSKLRRYEIPVPPLSEQRAVNAALDAADLRIQREKEHLEKLALLKLGLTDDLLSGRVRATGDRSSSRRNLRLRGQLGLEL